MATLGYPYLVISDGVTSATIASGAAPTSTDDYALVRDTWAPQIAGLRNNVLGGYSPYEDVVETFDVNIRGTSVTDCLRNAKTIRDLFDQAERWKREQNVRAVRLHYVPQGSTVGATATPFSADVVGYAPGDPPIQFPQTFNRVGNITEIDDIQIRFVRRGIWTNGTTTATLNVPYNSVQTTTNLSGGTVLAPHSLTLRPFIRSSSNENNLPSMLIAVTDTDPSFSNINLIAAESLATASFGSVNDNSNNATGGSVLRYSATGTTVQTTQIARISGNDHTPHVAWYATVRNNSTIASFQIAVQLTGFDVNIPVYGTLPPVLIDTSSTLPRIVNLGYTRLAPNQSTALFAPKWFRLAVSCSTASGTQTLDIDSIMVVGGTAPDTFGVLSTDSSKLLSGATANVYVRDNVGTYVAPSVFGYDTINAEPVSVTYRGNAMFVGRTNKDICIFAPAGTLWRANNTGGSVGTLAATIVKLTSYLIPE